MVEGGSGGPLVVPKVCLECAETQKQRGVCGAGIPRVDGAISWRTKPGLCAAVWPSPPPRGQRRAKPASTCVGWGAVHHLTQPGARSARHPSHWTPSCTRVTTAHCHRIVLSLERLTSCSARVHGTSNAATQSQLCKRKRNIFTFKNILKKSHSSRTQCSVLLLQLVEVFHWPHFLVNATYISVSLNSN